MLELQAPIPEGTQKKIVLPLVLLMLLMLRLLVLLQLAATHSSRPSCEKYRVARREYFFFSRGVISRKKAMQVLCDTSLRNDAARVERDQACYLSQLRYTTYNPEYLDRSDCLHSGSSGTGGCVVFGSSTHSDVEAQLRRGQLTNARAMQRATTNANAGSVKTSPFQASGPMYHELDDEVTMPMYQHSAKYEVFAPSSLLNTHALNDGWSGAGAAVQQGVASSLLLPREEVGISSRVMLRNAVAAEKRRH